MHHPGGMAATHSQAIARRCWHPSGMRVVIWDVTGGVATLNHRLMAGNPFGMARYALNDVSITRPLAWATLKAAPWADDTCIDVCPLGVLIGSRVAALTQSDKIIYMRRGQALNGVSSAVVKLHFAAVLQDHAPWEKDVSTEPFALVWRLGG